MTPENVETASSGFQAPSWRAFEAFCVVQGLPALPASPGAIKRFLESLAVAHKSPSTIRHAYATIAAVHKQSRHGWHPHEMLTEAVEELLAGLDAAHVPRTVDAVSPAQLQAMIATRGTDLRGLRDRALLALGHTFRRGQLVALDIGDVLDEPQHAFRVKDRVISDVFTIDAVRAWVATARITDGPLFRAISRSGRVLARRLSNKAFTLIVKDAAARTGLDPTRISTHSLRIR